MNPRNKTSDSSWSPRSTAFVSEFSILQTNLRIKPYGPIAAAAKLRFRAKTRKRRRHSPPYTGVVDHARPPRDGERAQARGVGAQGLHFRAEDAEIELAGALTGERRTRRLTVMRPCSSSLWLPAAFCSSVCRMDGH
eukprot:COSAG02_NODE_1115_length_14499_cov_46.098958_19_plen_137_part_00